MKLKLVLIASILLLFFQANGTESPFLQQAATLFEQQVQTLLEKDQTPGVVVTVTHHGKVIYSKGIGLKDSHTKEPMTNETLVRIASNTKMLTSIAVLQLWEKGIIDLDTPIVNYLPWFKLQDATETNRWQKITIRHLLNHTAGISRGEGIEFWHSPKLHEGILPSSDESLPFMLEQEVLADPGTNLKYSNLGYLILAHLIAQYGGAEGTSTNERYSNYMQQHILQPLHMEHSGFALKEKQRIQLATPYGILETISGTRPEHPKILDPGCLIGGWGLYTTSQDLAKLLIWLNSAFHGEENALLKPKTVQMMIAKPVKDSSSPTTYGLGIRVDRGVNRFEVGHSGLFIGYSSYINVDVKTGIGVAIVSNSMSDTAVKCTSIAYNTFGNALQGSPPLLPPPSHREPEMEAPMEPPPSLFKNLTGYYSSEFEEFVIYENAKGQLMYGNNPLELISSQTKRLDFRLGWEGGFGDVNGERLSFILGDNGQVEYLLFSNTNRAYRVADL